MKVLFVQDAKPNKEKTRLGQRMMNTPAAYAAARSTAKREGYKGVSTPYGRGYYKEGDLTFYKLNQLNRAKIGGHRK